MHIRSRPSYRRRPVPSAALDGASDAGCRVGRVVRWRAWVLDSGLRRNDEGFGLAVRVVGLGGWGSTVGGMSTCARSRRRGAGRYPVRRLAGLRTRGACPGGWCRGERGFWIPAFAGMTGGSGLRGRSLCSAVVLRCGLIRAPRLMPSYRRRPVPSAALDGASDAGVPVWAGGAAAGVGSGFRPSPE